MPNYDPKYSEQLRKLLRSFVGHCAVIAPVRVTLEDLLLSETRGRWWVVGSAWTGASLESTAAPRTSTNECSSSGNKVDNLTTEFSADFMKLAETFRITRPPKINILFVLTLGSEYVSDAFDKLLQLSLPPTQEKLVFDIMLYCVQRLRTYKPFFAVLANKLCSHHNKYKRLLQHSLWDKFSDFDNIKKQELKKLSTFVVEIVKADSLNLSVLKTVPFADANQKIIAFLEDVLCQLFDSSEGCQVSRYAFDKLFISKTLHPLRMQLKLFINMFILRKLEKGDLVPRSSLFKKRVLTVLDVLSTDHTAFM